ncbi:glycosyltransferase family 4 protein [Anaerobium acetethylicum]|uniref:glycosyltransferase family 4 protein n=1 Tax=Anaerobium acetethylicum TaxID=1619234 RepID=UPI001A9A3D56|nr:glycosyltransferase family 1 protein [Anaerobium acetethylicum]
MKILVDARTMGSRPSGVGMYTYNFMKELLKYPDIQFVLASDISVSREMEVLAGQNIRIIEYGNRVSKSFGLFGYFKFIQKCIHQEKPDIFWEPNNLMPVRIKNPYGRIMVTIHDLFPITKPEYYGRVYENYFRYGMTKTAKTADIFLYNSMETRQFMEKYYPAVKHKKNFISYIIINRIPVSSTADNGYFLYVGNLEKRKGVDLLLKAYSLYRKSGGTKELYLGGKIREEDIQKLYDEVSSTTEGVKYAGYLEEDRKKELYAGCSCFVFPSKAEGFGMPPVEVMNFGKPVILSNLNIFQEILGNHVTYFNLEGDEDAQIKNLCIAMNGYSEPDLEEYDKITEKFDAPNLGRKLKEFLEKVE